MCVIPAFAGGHSITGYKQSSAENSLFQRNQCLCSSEKLHTKHLKISLGCRSRYSSLLMKWSTWKMTRKVFKFHYPSFANNAWEPTHKSRNTKQDIWKVRLQIWKATIPDTILGPHLNGVTPILYAVFNLSRPVVVTFIFLLWIHWCFLPISSPFLPSFWVPRAGFISSVSPTHCIICI